MEFRFVKVWDGFVRFCHWAILALVVISFATAKSGRMDWHFVSGYAALTLLVFRVAWGFWGSENARFRAFLGAPAAALRQLSRLGKPEPDRETSHNPAGGWMVAVLLGLLLTQAVTGLFASDGIFSSGPLARRVSAEFSDAATSVHVRNFYLLLAAIAVHVLAVGVYRVAKGHDLLVPMVTGEKRLPADVPAPRLAGARLGLLLLAGSAAVVFGITQLRG
jgi:cytochrome b